MIHELVKTLLGKPPDLRADLKIFGITPMTGVHPETEGSGGFAGREEGTWKELQVSCSLCVGWFIKQPERALVPEVRMRSPAGTLSWDVCLRARVVRPYGLPHFAGWIWQHPASTKQDPRMEQVENMV